MKKHHFAILCLLLIASCIKEPNLDNGPNTFSFKTGSFTLVGHKYTATYAVNDTTYALSAVLIPADSSSLNINIAGNYYANAENYTVGKTGTHNTVLTSTYNSNGIIYSSTGGNLLVTTLDSVKQTISGTFQFSYMNTGAPFDTFLISNGKLSTLSYTK